MKSQTLHKDRSSTAGGRAGVKAVTVAQRWADEGLIRHEDGRQPLDDLRASSRRSQWSLQLFLLISTAAFLVRDFNLYTSLPENVLQVLGCPPPPLLAHCALAGYIFTVLTPLAIHLLSNDKPVAQWRHLGYRSAFYCFYLFSGTLAANFLLVLAIGVILYLLEQASICVAISRFSDDNGQFA